MKNSRLITIAPVALLTIAVLSAIAIRYAEPINDGDIWFHLAYGRYFLENHTLIPDHTVFSWTPTQNSTIYCTWLSDIVFFLLFKAGGMNVLYALRYAVIALFLALAYSLCRGSPARSMPLSLLICLVGLMMSYAGLRIKPEMFSFLFMAFMAWIWISIKQKNKDTRRLPYLLPVITLFWVNSHGGFIFGMGFLGLILAGEWINRISGSSEQLDDATWKSLFVSVVLSASALLINPYGWNYLYQLLNDIFLNPAELKWHMKTIQEYLSIFNRNMSAFHFIDSLIIAVSILLTLFAVQRRQKETDWSLLLANVFFMALYMKFLRTTYYWGIIFTFSSMYLLGRMFREGFATIPFKGSLKAAVQGVCVTLLCFMAARLVYDNYCSPNIGFNLSYCSPTSEADFIRSHLPGLRMGNDYSVGSYLMWSLHPERKVFIDARYFPYKKWYQEYIAFEKNIERGNTALFLKKYPCDFWCLSYNSQVIEYFVSSPEWKAIYYGPASCIFVSTRLNTLLMKTTASESIYTTNPYNAYSIAKSAAMTGNIDIARRLSEGMTPCPLCRNQKETVINAKLNVGNYLVGRKEYYEAIKLYSDALSLQRPGVLAGGKGKKSDIALLHDNLGYAYLKVNQVGDAARELDLALQMKPDAPNATRYLPLLREEMAKINASIARLKAALGNRPNDLNVLQALAVHYAMNGQYEDSLGYLERQLGINPDSPEIYYNMACIYSKQGNVQMAMSSLDMAVRKGFTNWELLSSDHDLDNLRSEPSFRKFIEGH